MISYSAFAAIYGRVDWLAVRRTILRESNGRFLVYCGRSGSQTTECSSAKVDGQEAINERPLS